MGHKVTVVTRKWERPVKSFTDMHYSTSEGTEVEKTDGYTVHRLPYQANKRDELLTEGGSGILRKLLTIKELILQPLKLNACPFSNMYKEARSICSEQKIDMVVVSGNPFIQFKFGYLLNKEFGIPWIADYRDAWTTSQINRMDKGAGFRIYEAYERPFEKKWVRTATRVTASSSSIGKSVEEITGVKSVPVYNGFDEGLFDGLCDIKKAHVFTITYVGTLYSGQNIELFLSGFKKFIDNYDPKVMLQFPGLALNKEQAKRVEQELVGYEKYYKITDRIPHEEILRMEKSSHVLLHVAWKGFKGIIASKIYEYIGSGTPILICPGDDGDIDRIVMSARAGVLCNSPDEVVLYLTKHMEYSTEERSKGNKGEIDQFTRQAQARILAKEMRHLSA